MKKAEITLEVWIKCEKQLPEKDGQYLAVIREEGEIIVTPLDYSIKYGWDTISAWTWIYDLKEIIYWMPYPKPPKDII